MNPQSNHSFLFLSIIVAVLGFFTTTARADEIRQMAHLCGIKARVSLEKLSQPEPEEAADDDQAEEERPALDAGIDGETKAQRW